MTKYLFASALAIASLAGCKAKSTDNANDKSAPADNTARNKRDTNLTPTADKAVNNSTDLDLTQQIRKAVEADGSLSTNAHNCKIVVQDGTVTLVGPVSNAEESTRVQQIASNVVGTDRKVINQLEVTN